MRGISTIAPLAVALGATAASASAIPENLIPSYFKRASSLPEVTVKGNAFFAGSSRFYIRGVDYQPGGSSDAVDPIADEAICKRDIVEFQKLKINTVRVYTVDNSANHDACMTALANAGIYLALDVNTPKYSINQASPADSYNSEYLQSLFATVDVFQTYSNTLLFFSGNEVINSVPTSNAAPYVKAVTRDLKQYIGNRKYRQIPVGYSAADIDDNRVETAHYMNCGTDDERSDFFAFNDYSWCDPSTYQTSTWQQKVQAFSNYSIPIFLSEYGCVKTTRKFQEVATLYGTQMTAVYSGGLVYEYSKEGTAAPGDQYGLVDISGNSVSEQTDFQSLQSAFQGTPLPTDDGGYKSTGSPSICPTKSSTWLVSGDGLPAMPPKASAYFKNGAGKGPGLSGSGSQNAGAESPGTATAGSGQATATSTSKSVAGGRPADFSMGPVACGLVVLLSSFLGATLL
ncbi:beta-glucanosyltransferase [Lepraria neglecta]|uniref:1,3-beta-glucanosyltransferase n=1 Tax=Lepraria neglecta TaxID=209136 RepID=A0AAD9ZHB4_9LECA|nr:beta-glucanosyltransferase [Lepraria neglecta]